MGQESVVAVYGLKHGRTRPTRLGAGILIDAQLVVVKQGLAKQLGDAQAPSVLRVGIGSNDDHPLVEVIEVTQTMRSRPTGSGRLWALELADSSEAPTDPFNMAALLREGSEGQQAAAPPDQELSQLVREHEEGQRRADPQARAAAAVSGGRRIFCWLWPGSSFCP